MQLKLKQFEYEEKKTDVRTTSIYSYLYILDTINVRQLTAFYVLKKLGAANNRELAEAMNKPINEVTPRIHELRNMWRCKYCGHTRTYAHKIKPDKRGNRRCTKCYKLYNGFYVKYPLVEESHRGVDGETKQQTIYWKVITDIDKRM